ncbi:16S rRNA (cytidine(1402)-2'-O)-methyltransferase [Niallia sp. Sow4_A1]|jgi:16S rRNA (cytidine1402-2'-O)-methyltransferase|uniref:Ribosomal RNA small subunit methyltransferase I n=1 Tax=Niallia hominis TaxID=3133173 RepID=A0ABV1EZQ2_9BACI|nr:MULTISPECIES: 16S rRNA (cytidine(1402)-2'-O)-methyltransferase [Bacillaceae]MCF2648604.1 16S rRNA (cytidine(1402)-2'-O)-methyltransferase [Niallia circulans]MCM3363667.1 16S rRNA (cytidine(1402)-2'-O)-methyltransferase [Niallia sp. MER TA 168]
MKQQKSYKEKRGSLYLVPTPIGNLEDMSFRAIRILKEADVIAAEDTRNTKKLCNYFEITTPVVSYHEHNKETSGQKLIQALKEEKVIALVSDAGMPTIADPGYELVIDAIAQEIPVIPLPGANAALTALIASGLPTHPFYFYGFLNRQKKEKKKELLFLKTIPGTILLYESPHRLKETLTLIMDILGNRKITLCRELTKLYEEFIRGTVEEAIAWSQSEEIRGEFCLVIEQGEFQKEEENNWWDELTVVQQVNHYVQKEGITVKEAIKKTALDRGMQKRDVYQEYHIE